jgi:hypothetical protein
MTSFTLAGGFFGRHVEITWIDGVLSSSDEEMLKATEHWLSNTGNGGSSAAQRQIKNPHVACDMMKMLLQNPEIVSGALPPIPDPSQE